MTTLENQVVFIIGLGGLGAPAVKTLCDSGLRHFRLVDSDVVDASNLHRQTLYKTEHIGLKKVEVAKAYLESRGCEVQAFDTRFSWETSQLMAGADVAIEGTDNLPSKYVASEVARWSRVPLVTAGALRWGGWALKGGTSCKVLSNTLHDACIACLFGELPTQSMESCEFAGVVGPAVGALGIMEAIFALEVLSETSPSENGALFRLDGLLGNTRRTPFVAQAGCTAKGVEVEPAKSTTFHEEAMSVQAPIASVKMLDERRGEVLVRGQFASGDEAMAELRRKRPGLATLCGSFAAHESNPSQLLQGDSSAVEKRETLWVSRFELSKRSLFSRHALLSEFANDGQEKLLSASVGSSFPTGLLSRAESTALDYLQRAGVHIESGAAGITSLLQTPPLSPNTALGIAYAHLSGALAALEFIRRTIGLPKRAPASLPQAAPVNVPDSKGCM